MPAAVDGLDEGLRQRLWARIGGGLQNRHDRVTTTPSENLAAEDESEAVLALATGPPDVTRILGGFVFTVLPDAHLHSLLRQRPEAWRASFAAEILGEWAREREVGLFGPFWARAWLTFRGVVRAGLLPAEPRDEYLLLMVRGLTFSGAIDRELEADPQLLRAEVWELFEATPPVLRALVGGDRYFDSANTWGPALVRLARRGMLEESRLRARAEAAAADERHATGHRRWFARLIKILDDPRELPPPTESEALPPGNRLRRIPDP